MKIFKKKPQENLIFLRLFTFLNFYKILVPFAEGRAIIFRLGEYGAEISKQSLDALSEILLQLLNGNTEHYLRLYKFSLPFVCLKLSLAMQS
jgi:hypothetical protein